MLFGWLFLVLAQDLALRIADPSAQTRIRVSEPSGGTGVTPSGRAVPRDGRTPGAALAFMAFMALLATGLSLLGVLAGLGRMDLVLRHVLRVPPPPQRRGLEAAEGSPVRLRGGRKNLRDLGPLAIMGSPAERLRAGPRVPAGQADRAMTGPGRTPR
jgi:hypothetical protein